MRNDVIAAFVLAVLPAALVLLTIWLATGG
jgi:hypothetical protein